MVVIMSIPVTPVIDRIVKTPGCWHWKGGHSETGYGRCYVGRGPRNENVYRMAHLVVYELLVGPIPEGVHLHHTCENPGCVRPSHMEPLTPKAHKRRHSAERLVCANGHPLPPKVELPDRRRCPTCYAEHWKRANKRRSDERAARRDAVVR